MTVIAKKVERSTLLILQLVIGALMMAGGFVLIPIAVFSIDAELLKNLFVWAFVLVEMLFFGLVGFFSFIRPFFLFRTCPDVQAETDGSYLYIYGKKQAKIPLIDLRQAKVNVVTPYMMSKEFIIHLISDRYGKVILKVPEYGKFKLYFVQNADAMPFIIEDLAKGGTIA